MRFRPVFLLFLLAAPPARAGDFVDTRLTFAFGDDDVLHGSGETTPNSPAAGFLPGGQNTQFFDNYNSKTSGFDNFANLVVWKKLDSYFERLSIDAALALRLNQNAIMYQINGVQPLRDESSYIRLRWQPEGWGPKDNIQFIGFPMSSDRFRLGYAYRISWGGNNLFPTGWPVPGAKMQVRYGGFTGYAGVKATLILNSKINELETNYAGMGGVSFDVAKGLRLEANGGFFQRGANPKPEVLGAPVQTAGGSAQVSYTNGDPIGTSIDFALYSNDPSAPQKFFKPETYPGGFSWSISTQGTGVATTLADPDRMRAGSTKWQPGYAGDLQFKAKLDYLRLHATGMVRDVAFLTLNVPSIPPYQIPASTVQTTPEFFFAAGADYHVPSIHLTPGFVVGLQMPASMTAGGLGDVLGNNPASGDTGRRSVVLRQDPSFPDRILLDILPNTCGASKDLACAPTPIYGAKVTTRLDLGDSSALAGEVYGNYNPNRVRYADDEYGVAQRTYDAPLQIGFTLLASTRF